jgi:hypothetical protein
MGIEKFPTNVMMLLQKGISGKLVRDYKTVFNSEEGQNVLRDLAIRFKLADICKDNLDEGGRRVILHIITMLELDPRDFSSLYKTQGEE